jgi:hypothetical protein
MNDATIRNIIAQEFRTMQQRLTDRIVTKADLNSVVDRVVLNSVSKQDIAQLRAVMEDVRAEQRMQRQAIKQLSAYIESLERNTKSNANQLGTLWRFVQQ